MHMADAMVAPAVAGTMYVCSSLVAGGSIRQMKLEDYEKKLPVMGVMGAFVFAAQMINFTIPGTGSSGHLAGGMLLSAIVGPYAGFITMIAILLIQSLLFADGGILALGCNIWNMAFYGCFVGSFLIWKLMMRNGINKTKIMVASIVGCIITLQMGAFSVVVETTVSGITELPFQVFVTVMLPIHLAIGLVEGVITGMVLSFVYEARPELLWMNQRTSLLRSFKKENAFKKESSCQKESVCKDTKDSGEIINEMNGKLSFRTTMYWLASGAIIIAGVLSLFASALPDGLEWSVEKVTGNTEVASSGMYYEFFQKIQEFTAIFPDYMLKNSDSSAGTSISGIFGVMLLIFVCCGISAVTSRIRKRKTIDE